MSITLSQWTEAQKYNTGFGIPLNDEYPLSTYQPISSQQLDILAAQYYIKKDLSIPEITDLQSKLLEYDSEENIFTFNELFPTKYHFAQSVANNSGFVFNNFDLESFPNKKYYLMSIFQEQLLDKEYSKQKAINKYYTNDELIAFCKKIENESIMPKQYLQYYVVNNEGLMYT